MMQLLEPFVPSEKTLDMPASRMPPNRNQLVVFFSLFVELFPSDYRKF